MTINEKLESYDKGIFQKLEETDNDFYTEVFNDISSVHLDNYFRFYSYGKNIVSVFENDDDFILSIVNHIIDNLKEKWLKLKSDFEMMFESDLLSPTQIQRRTIESRNNVNKDYTFDDVDNSSNKNMNESELDRTVTEKTTTAKSRTDYFDSYKKFITSKLHEFYYKDVCDFCTLQVY